MTTYIIPPTVLYIKQHSVTGLKYFGKTTQDPLKYNGSGVYWTDHIKKHGKEHIITTRLFGPFTNSIAISEFALAFSRDNNIVESKDWANIMPENGLHGGSSPGPRGKQQNPSGPRGKQQNPHGPRGPSGKQQNPSKKPSHKKGKPGKPCSDETKQKMHDAKIGKTQSPEHIKNRTDSRRRNEKEKTIY
jgi:hypothetical protein